MFDRFTERARRAVVLAQEESGRLRHGFIGAEHLLLGLIREGEGVAARALYACGVTLDEAREGVEGIVGYGEDGDASQKPFTPRSKRVLEMSLQEAQDLRQDHIGTEHLLLGLLAEGGGVATAVLSSLDVDPERVRREVLGRLGGGARSRSQGGLGPLGWAREALRRSFGRYPRAEDRASFEKFTGPARSVVVLAQDEARRFDHNYIGTEHLLLGLIREGHGVAAGVLEELGVHLNEAREQVESIVGREEATLNPHVPFTPRTSNVLRHTLREATHLGHDYVSTEHILLGLVREGEGVAARVFLNLKVDPDAVRREVVRRLPGEEPEFGPPSEPRIGEEEQSRTLFRGRVGGIRAELDLPRPVSVTADAYYAYLAPAGSADGAATVGPGDVADVMRTGLREADSPSLEAVITVLGERLLDSFSEMMEVSVTVSGSQEPEEPPAPTFSVSATFLR